jgi:hydrogenase maturation protein HypF
MAGFRLCDACAREYHDPTDRRFHAQPVCCQRCGPTLRVVDRDGATLPGDPISVTARLLNDGAVLAIKGLGGYHLAADAESDAAVTALRTRKHRADKPFALMVPHLEAAHVLCLIEAAEAGALTSPSRPIVMLRRRSGARVAAAVAPGNRFRATENGPPSLVHGGPSRRRKRSCATRCPRSTRPSRRAAYRSTKP